MAERFVVPVCGGRDYADAAKVAETLGAIHAERPISALVHGAASGADDLAHRWARENEILACPCPADWKKHGRKAGPIRNAWMLAEWRPQLVVAFPGGKGTADMVAKAERAGVPVRRVGEGEA